MVAGKVRGAIGFHRSPSKPKKETTTTTPPPPKQFSSPSSAKLPQKSSSGGGGGGGSASFSRSFGVYFPRFSSQVEPRPSADVAELLRVVEELRERESRLRTELLEHKILKETVAIVPFLEKEIAFKDKDLAKSLLEIDALKAENERLRREVETLMSKIDDGEAKDLKLKEMETEIENLKKAVSEREQSEQKGLLCRDPGEVDDCSSSQRFQGLIDASAKSSLLKNLKRSAKSSDIVVNHENRKPESVDLKGEETESSERTQQTRCEAEDLASVVRSRVPRVPKPPPKPTPSPSTSSSSSSSSSSSTSSSDSSRSFEVTQAESATAERLKLSCLPPIPPPPPPPPPPPSLPRRSVVAVSRGSAGAAPPPPPPPPPKKGSRSAAARVRRVPEVVEFYHSLMRRDSKRDSGAGTEAPAQASAANARNMIGEIENRSAHLLAIKTDVETQGDFIRFLIKEVNEAAFTNIEDVVAFVKWLDDELSFLVDERAVLKHFDWPEHKADAMREAAFGYCDLKKLELEASSFKDDVQRQSCSSALKKMQSLLEKLEHGVYNVSRVREAATKRYRGFQIPSEWMLESGLVSQIKLASVKLAMKYMKRVTAEMEAVESGPEEEELVLQGVRFAFRVHQFAGGFDVETMRAFEELRDKSRSCNSQGQNHHHQQQH